MPCRAERFCEAVAALHFAFGLFRTALRRESDLVRPASLNALRRFAPRRISLSRPFFLLFCFAIWREYLRRAAALLGHIPQYAPSRRLARRGVPHPHGFAKEV